MAQLNIVSVTVTELLIRFSWPMVTLFSAAINGTVCYSFFILQPGYCPLYFYVSAYHKYDSAIILECHIALR